MSVQEAAESALPDPIPGLKPLSEDNYVRGHLQWRKSSGQQAAIEAWLGRAGERLAAKRSTFSVLSIGCGAGIADRPLASGLLSSMSTAASSHRGPALVYEGIEPSASLASRFIAGFEPLKDAVACKLDPCTFEEYASAQRFDLVLSIHVVYYHEDPRAALAKATAHLNDEGVLIFLVAPRKGLSRFFEVAMPQLSGRKPWLADDVLSALDLPCAALEIDAVADVTESLEPTSTDGKSVLDFIIHGDTSAVPERTQQRLRSSLRAMGDIEGGRVLVPHPVTAVMASRSQQRLEDVVAALQP